MCIGIKLEAAQEVFYKNKGVLTNFANSQENTYARVSFFNKVAGLSPQVFFCEFCEIVRMLFSQNTSGGNASVKYIFLYASE